MTRSQYAAAGIIACTVFVLPLSVFADVSINQVYTEIETQYKLPQGVLAKIANAESRGDPNARAKPPSTAVGLFQWIEDSWLRVTKALYGASLHLDSRTDPVTSAKVTAFSLAQARDKNGPLIEQAKIDMSLGLYMGHFLGPAGAAVFLTAYIQNPNANAASIFPKEAQYNPTVFSSRTLAEILNERASKLKVAGVTINVAGNFSDPMGISMARSDADVGMNDFYPTSFVPTGQDLIARTRQTTLPHPSRACCRP